jgi:predicted 3-demethylubiquinone-9 3-methyltransferase (glyoxalase superfamily)
MGNSYECAGMGETAMNRIVPHLWFDKEAREAADFYCSAFPNSSIVSSIVLRDTPSQVTALPESRKRLA